MPLRLATLALALTLFSAPAGAIGNEAGSHEGHGDKAGSDQYEKERQRSLYLVTMYPGDALFTGFGHIALRISDPATGADDTYDYGTYDADDPQLGWKFLNGTLSYYCSHSQYEDMVSWYSGEFGGIIVQ